MTIALLMALLPGLDPPAPAEPSLRTLEAAKYGVTCRLPSSWPIAVREQQDRVFVALIPQADPDRPGVAACELSIAPESLNEYKTRIDGNARRQGPAGGTLTRNEVVKSARGERLETLREFRPGGGALWRERTVRVVAHRQLYAFILNVDETAWSTANPAFDALIESCEFRPPNTGAVRTDERRNRWSQNEFRFEVELPEHWAPLLAPSEVALLYAAGPPHGLWSDNLLVLAQSRRPTADDLVELARSFPDRLRKEDPDCEVLACGLVFQGMPGQPSTQALETIVRTRRGPFSMTVLERRFAGSRLGYEVKFTLESERFDAAAPALRGCFDSFRELPEKTPVPNPKPGREG